MEDGRFMTNVDIFDGISEVVAEAARLSNLRVEYENFPMPLDYDDHEMFDDETGEPIYVPEAYIGLMGSIVTYDSEKDHGEFWDHFNRLKSEALGAKA